MQVSGTAFRDVTNQAKRHRGAVSHPCHKQDANFVTSTQHASSVAAVPHGATILPPLQAQVNKRAAHATESSVSYCSDGTRSSQSAEVQRQARRLHRKRVARIVADQWKWFTKDRIKLHSAIRHHRRRLLLTAFLAFQRHTAHRQLEWRRAAIFNHRRQYLIQGKCLLVWHAHLAFSKNMQQMLRRAQLARHWRLQRACLTAWKGYRSYKAKRRRQHLQASFYNIFVLLSSAVHCWRSAAQASAIRQAKKRRAITFWAAKQYDLAFNCWVIALQAKQTSRQRKDQAISLHRQHLTQTVLRHWHTAAICMVAGRQAGAEALQVILCWGPHS